MAVPEQALAAKLKDTAGVTALVSTRIYPMYRPGTVLPAIVYEVSQDIPSNYAGGTTDTSQMFLAVDCIASTYAGARALSAVVESTLSGWTDSDGRVWHLTSTSDDVGDPMTGQSVPEYFAVTHTYTVWH